MARTTSARACADADTGRSEGLVIVQSRGASDHDRTDFSTDETTPVSTCAAAAEPVVLEGFAEDFDPFLGGVVRVDAGEDADALEHAADCFGDDVRGVGRAGAVNDGRALV